MAENHLRPISVHVIAQLQRLPCQVDTEMKWFFGVLAPALKCNCGFSLIFLTLGLGLGLEKFIQHRLRWFGHIQRRPPKAPVHSGILKHDGNMRRGRGRPKLTWKETIRRDLKDWSIPRVLSLDRSAWKAAIHVPEP